jgi:hypothetical protein
MAVAGCSAAVSGEPAALHAAAAAILTTASPCTPDQACPCGSTSCHGGRGKANLVLVGAVDLNMTLVGKTSCQAPNVPLVAAGGGEAALNNRLAVAQARGAGRPVGHARIECEWGAAQLTCNQLAPAMQPFGTRMPMSNSDMLLSEARLAPIRNWICAGAPGP